jgi:hypothetical protein
LVSFHFDGEEVVGIGLVEFHRAFLALAEQNAGGALQP